MWTTNLCCIFFIVRDLTLNCQAEFAAYLKNVKI